MKKISFLVAVVILAGCTSTINSVVDPSYSPKKPENPMIAIIYEYGPNYSFSNRLKKKLEQYFYEDQRKIEIFLVENKKHELKIEANNETADIIETIIQEGDNDLAIIVKPTFLYFKRYSFKGAEYEISAIQTKTNKVIWRSEFDFQTFLGSYTVVEKVANQIYSTLKSDHVL